MTELFKELCEKELDEINNIEGNKKVNNQQYKNCRRERIYPIIFLIDN